MDTETLITFKPHIRHNTNKCIKLQQDGQAVFTTINLFENCNSRNKNSSEHFIVECDSIDH